VYTGQASFKKGRPLPFRSPSSANLAGQDVSSCGALFSAGFFLLVSDFQAANISASSTIVEQGAATGQVIGIAAALGIGHLYSKMDDRLCRS
jgi:hypothetical protein